MSKTVSKTNVRNVSSQSTGKSKVVWNFPLNKKDLIWLLISVGVVALGYILLATGMSEEPAAVDGTWNNFIAVDVAPIVLVIGYCVLIPMTLMKFFTRGKNKVQVVESANDK